MRRFAPAEGLSRPFELHLEVLTPDLATNTGLREEGDESTASDACDYVVVTPKPA